MKMLSSSAMNTTAYTLFMGPGLLDVAEDASAFLYGRQLIWLGSTRMGPRHLESRALYMLYAERGKEEQSIAIVRGSDWRSSAPHGRIIAHNEDGTVTMQMRGERQPTYPTTVAVRFVAIPIQQAQDWIAHFDRLPLMFLTQRHKAAKEERALKVEWEQAVQLTWRTRHPDYAALNDRWETMWALMGTALATAPLVHGVREDFFTRERPDTAVYDFTTYPLPSHE